MYGIPDRAFISFNEAIINQSSHVTSHHDWTSESTMRLRESRTYNLKRFDRILFQICVVM